MCFKGFLLRVINTRDYVLTLYQTTKFKAFADDKINVTKKLKFVLRRVENIVGKGENAGYQQCFQKASYTRLLKVRIVW